MESFINTTKSSRVIKDTTFERSSTPGPLRRVAGNLSTAEVWVQAVAMVEYKFGSLQTHTDTGGPHSVVRPTAWITHTHIHTCTRWWLAPDRPRQIVRPTVWNTHRHAHQLCRTHTHSRQALSRSQTNCREHTCIHMHACTHTSCTNTHTTDRPFRVVRPPVPNTCTHTHQLCRTCACTHTHTDTHQAGLVM